MARMMIGKDLPVLRARRGQARAAKSGLRLAGLSHASDDPFGTDLKDIHLEVHSGEIVGIAGVSGNGQQELLYAMSGEGPLAEKYPGADLRHRGRADAPGPPAQGSASASCRRSASVAARCRSMSLAENAILTAHRARHAASRAHRFRGGRAPSPPSASSATT